MAAPKKKTKTPNVKLHCNDCRQQTFHRLLKEAKDSGGEQYDEDYGVWWETRHQMFECLGCKSVLIRRIHEFSEWDQPEVRYFPPRISRHRPEWFEKVPAGFQLILLEIYKSLDADNRALPLMGARTVLDMLIVDKVGDVGTFAEKMKKLKAEGFISEKNREILEIALDAGHAAAHRGHVPKGATINSVMDILENLLQATYVLADVAAEVRKSIPPRPQRVATSKS